MDNSENGANRGLDLFGGAKKKKLKVPLARLTLKMFHLTKRPDLNH